MQLRIPLPLALVPTKKPPCPSSGGHLLHPPLLPISLLWPVCRASVRGRAGGRPCYARFKGETCLSPESGVFSWRALPTRLPSARRSLCVVQLPPLSAFHPHLLPPLFCPAPPLDCPLYDPRCTPPPPLLNSPRCTRPLPLAASLTSSCCFPPTPTTPKSSSRRSQKENSETPRARSATPTCPRCPKCSWGGKSSYSECREYGDSIIQRARAGASWGAAPRTEPPWVARGEPRTAALSHRAMPPPALLRNPFPPFSAPSPLHTDSPAASHRPLTPARILDRPSALSSPTAAAACAWWAQAASARRLWRWR